MALNCPSCNSITTEMRECDKCGKIGCHKCLSKKKNEWLCIDCKNGKEQNQISDVFSSMFG
ncbi:MAG: hypothetical protein QXM68_03125 [Candidatus Aenigmatarchaeota archaeon]|nr:hypothetical protein [Candidatus Aenigmarchaeota archaeon]